MLNYKTLKLNTLIAILDDFTDHYAEIRVTEPDKAHVKVFKDAIDKIQLEITTRRLLRA